MVNKIILYLFIGLVISAYNGNLNSCYTTEYRVKSVLYWPVYAVNYFNAISNINQVDEKEIAKNLRKGN